MNEATAQPNGKVMTWIGRGFCGIFVLFMLGASVTPKLFMPHVADETMTALGWPTKYTPMIGVIELVGTILYIVPRTALLGAVLLMGLLGGAIAAQLRVENPLFSHILFGLYLGVIMWGGLWLRDPALRRMFPIARR